MEQVVENVCLATGVETETAKQLYTEYRLDQMRENDAYWVLLRLVQKGAVQ